MSTTPEGVYKPAIYELNYGAAVNANFDILDMLMQGWARPNWTFAYVNSTSFTIAGDKTALISVGQVLQTVDGAASKYASIITARSYSGGTGLTTVTVQHTNVPVSLSYILLAVVNTQYLTGVSYNTFLGYQAGNAITSGNYNVFAGYQAGLIMTTGHNNNFIGRGAGNANIAGQYNNFIGDLAGDQNTGDANNFVGAQAGRLNATGSNNTFVGTGAGYTGTGSSGNVFLGRSAGYYETGSNKLFIDNVSRASEADARLKALIYGVFGTNPVDQSIQVNGFIGTYKGANVTAAATIAPTGQIFHITGTTQTTLITIPYAGWTGQITVIPDNTGPTWTTATGGTPSGLNYPIRPATTAVQYKAITFTFDGTYFYPSY